MKKLIICLCGVFFFSFSAPAIVGLEEQVKCFRAIPLRLSPYSGPAKTVAFLSEAGEAELKAETRNSRLMNGSLMVVSTPEGERTVLVLADLLNEHRRHGAGLPRGWKVVRYVHRGEFEVKDGVILRANETSGSAFKAGQAENNKVTNLMPYLAGTRLVTEATRFDSYDKENEHYYKGFDEPGGTPDGLHKKRERFQKSVDLIRNVLRAQLYDILTGDKEVLPEFLAHWDVYTQGLSSAELRSVAPLKEGAERAAAGKTLTEQEAAPMLAALKILDRKETRTFVFEVK